MAAQALPAPPSQAPVSPAPQAPHPVYPLHYRVVRVDRPPAVVPEPDSSAAVPSGDTPAPAPPTSQADADGVNRPAALATPPTALTGSASSHRLAPAAAVSPRANNNSNANGSRGPNNNGNNNNWSPAGEDDGIDPALLWPGLALEEGAWARKPQRRQKRPRNGGYDAGAGGSASPSVLGACADSLRRCLGRPGFQRFAFFLLQAYLIGLLVIVVIFAAARELDRYADSGRGWAAWFLIPMLLGLELVGLIFACKLLVYPSMSTSEPSRLIHMANDMAGVWGWNLRNSAVAFEYGWYMTYTFTFFMLHVFSDWEKAFSDKEPDQQLPVGRIIWWFLVPQFFMAFFIFLGLVVFLVCFYVMYLEFVQHLRRLSLERASRRRRLLRQQRNDRLMAIRQRRLAAEQQAAAAQQAQQQPQQPQQQQQQQQRQQAAAPPQQIELQQPRRPPVAAGEVV